MRTEPLEPFGLRVILPAGTRWSELDADEVRGWVDEHRVVVIRGLTGLDKRSLGD